MVVEHGKVRYVAPLALQLIHLAPSEGSRTSENVLDMDPSVVEALHSTQVCYFLGAKPPGLGLLHGTGGYGQLLANTAVQTTLDPKRGITGHFF